MLTLKLLVKRLHLAAYVAALAVVFAASSAVAVRADLFYISSNYGETLWLSCGSSAGNYYAYCPENGGSCWVDQGAAQEEADAECAKRGF